MKVKKKLHHPNFISICMNKTTPVVSVSKEERVDGTIKFLHLFSIPALTPYPHAYWDGNIQAKQTAISD